jgi:hypothetical protein
VQNFFLKIDVLDLLIFENQVFSDTLHSEEFAGLVFVLHNVDFTESTATDHLLDVEVCELSVRVRNVSRVAHFGGSARHIVLHFPVRFFVRSLVSLS